MLNTMPNPVQLFLLLLLLGLNQAAVSAKVYKTVDEDGNIIFSDAPADDSVEVKLDDPISIPPATDRQFEYTPQQKKTSLYKKIQIVSPKNDEAIRSNEGTVSVSVVVEPALSSGHTVVLYLDGQEYGRGSTSFNLSNLDRGTHSLRAVVKSADDKLLLSSATISFHILRHSALFRRPDKQQVVR